MDRNDGRTGGTPLNELHINLLGKVLFATLGAALVGKVVQTKLRGSPDQLQAVADALLASRAFQDELRRPGATVDSVVEKMNIKNMTAAQFRATFGIPWPL